MSSIQYEWYECVDNIRPYVAKIFTPKGSGTGFLLANSPSGGICGVGTAAHVVSHSHWWEFPIHIQHFETGETKILREKDRAMFIDLERDTAVIMFMKEDLPFPDDVLPITPEDSFLRIGNEIGWVGFPALSPDSLCFFSGRVSSYKDTRDYYLVDGVAINGVSGGPAFSPEPDNSVRIIGVISAYIPNRATSEALPGLLKVAGVRRYHEVIQSIESLDDAKEREEEESPDRPDDIDSQSISNRA